MSTPAIEVQHLSVTVRPHFWARPRQLLHDVSLHVETGEIFGFIGPNGAGKTTTIKALLGLWRPNKGTTRLFGKPATDPSARANLGFMPERAYFPETLTGSELVRQHAHLAGLRGAAAKQRCTEVLRQVGIEPAAKARLGTYSKGMLQRLGLAQALVGDPALVVLDEPMSGLDPIGRHDVREIMLALRAAGKTVFFSTHILPDVELICDRVAILAAGRVRCQGRLADLVSPQRRFEVAATGVPMRTFDAQALAAPPRHHGDTTTFEVEGLAALNSLIDALRARQATVCNVQSRTSALEALFMDAAGANSEVHP